MHFLIFSMASRSEPRLLLIYCRAVNINTAVCGLFNVYSALPAHRTQGHKTVEPVDRRQRTRENRRPGRVQRVRRQRRPVEFERGHAGVRGTRSAGPVDNHVQRQGAGRVGVGVHAVRVHLRSAAVHGGLRVGRARADQDATGAVAGRTGDVAAAGAPVAQAARQGPEHQDHATGRQATRLGDEGRCRTAAHRTGQLSAGRGQRGGDAERRQIHT